MTETPASLPGSGSPLACFSRLIYSGDILLVSLSLPLVRLLFTSPKPYKRRRLNKKNQNKKKLVVERFSARTRSYLCSQDRSGRVVVLVEAHSYGAKTNKDTERLWRQANEKRGLIAEQKKRPGNTTWLWFGGTWAASAKKLTIRLAVSRLKLSDHIKCTPGNKMLKQRELGAATFL